MEAQSLFSEVRNVDQYQKIRFDQFHDLESWKAFQKVIRKGDLSLKYDSLGELLGIANFFGKSDSVEYALQTEEKSEDEYLATITFVKEQFGIDEKKQQACFLQGTDPQEITAFVQQWYDAQGKRKRWNPNYAKPAPQQKIYDLASGSPEKWLDRLSLPYNFEQSYDEEEKDTIDFWKGKRSSSLSSIFLPFDHWTLAECFKRQYASK